MPTPMAFTRPGRHTRLLGVGAYRPRRVVGNEGIAARIDVSAEWIESRSGIKTRRYAEDDETLAVMGLAASTDALAMAGLEPGMVDCVIVATTTHLTQMPALAPEIAATLGIAGAAAFDISAACAGFCHALGIASDLVSAGTADHVLVIGAERVTDILDRDDPSTAFLFADGAGAVVVGPSDVPGIGPVVWGSDGTRLRHIGMTGFWIPELRADHELPWPRLGMTGWKVYRWATEELVAVSRKAVEAAGLTPAQLDAFVPHQANILITHALANGLELPDTTAIAHDIADTGNTSAASIPLAIERMVRERSAPGGGNALLIGFGSGLVYAAQVVALP